MEYKSVRDFITILVFLFLIMTVLLLYQIAINL